MTIKINDYAMAQNNNDIPNIKIIFHPTVEDMYINISNFRYNDSRQCQHCIESIINSHTKIKIFKCVRNWPCSKTLG